MSPQRQEIAPGIFTLAGTEHQLRALIRQRDRLVQEIAAIDAEMLTLRRRYADERGEFVPPAIERLRRELLNG